MFGSFCLNGCCLDDENGNFEFKNELNDMYECYKSLSMRFGWQLLNKIFK